MTVATLCLRSDWASGRPEAAMLRRSPERVPLENVEACLLFLVQAAFNQSRHSVGRGCEIARGVQVAFSMWNSCGPFSIWQAGLIPFWRTAGCPTARIGKCRWWIVPEFHECSL